MRSTRLITALLLLVGVAAAQEYDIERLEQVLRDPPATGIAVTMVGPGSQAAENGVAIGDVVVAYGNYPTPTVELLNRAKELVGEVEWIEMELVNADGPRTIRLRPGSIGINGVSVVEGVNTETLPKDTGVTFDFSQLMNDSWDDWYAFHLGGPEKVGFEHAKLSLVGGKLILRREVAFDGGEAWGLNHFDVTAVITADGRPQAVATRFKNPITDWVGTGRASGGVWKVVWPDLSSEVELPSDDPVIPSYFIEILAAFMPREEGACFSFRGVEEGMGTIDLPAVILCAGREEIEYGGEKIAAWRYQRLAFAGAITTTFWFRDGPRAPAVRVDYGGAQGVLSTKEAVLKGLHPDLKVQSE